MIGLDDIGVFARVVQAGSFTRAAQDLGLPKSTVSRRLSALEERLGVLLLQRTTRKLSLTDAGRAFYQHAARIIAEADEAESTVTRMQELPRGLLRVTAPVNLAFLGPIASRFLAAEQEVQLELVCTDRIVDLVDEGFDVGLRVGPLAESTLVAKALVALESVVVASPAFLRAHGAPEVPKDLAALDCVVFGGPPDPTRWTLRRRGAGVVVHVRSRALMNNFDMIAEAACDGLGIALMPWHLAQPLVKAKRLVRVLADWCSPPRTLFAVYPSTRLLAPKVRAFIDHLSRELDPAPWVSGHRARANPTAHLT
jgi:DNA-binding transcriptional LysR family regulator